jgi:hypothetical protein
MAGILPGFLCANRVRGRLRNDRQRAPPMTKAANCLNLVGDGDDVDVVYAVERAFAIKISKAEAARCETVGALFDIVSSKLNVSEARNPGCPTALAFFRLRAALRRLGHVERVTPKTDLRAIFRAHGTRRLYLGLSREADLELPALALHPAGIAGSALVMACGPAFAVWTVSWLPMLGCTILAVILPFLLPKAIPEPIARLGDFAVHCAAWNQAKLAGRIGAACPRDIWKALTIIVREVSGTDFNGEINRDTRFFAARKS